MKTLLLVLALLWAVPASAAIAIVGGQAESEEGNDVAVTFVGAPSASNHIFILAAISSITQTIAITGWATSVTTLSFVELAGERHYLFCALGDGADTAFTATTSGAGAAHVFALEVSGAVCDAVDDESSEEITPNADPWALTTDLTTTAAGDIVFGLALVASGAFTVSGQSGTLIEDVTSEAVGQYQIVGAAGAYDVTFDWASTEGGNLLGWAVKAESPPAGTTPRGTLTGILP